MFRDTAAGCRFLQAAVGYNVPQNTSPKRQRVCSDEATGRRTRWRFGLVFSNVYDLHKSDDDTMSDPYFQTMFADRIGGAQYGKGTEIYKFEKIKRAKRNALGQSHPDRRVVGLSESERTIPMADQPRSATSWPERNRHLPENRGYADNGVIGIQGGSGTVHAATNSVSSLIRQPKSTIASVQQDCAYRHVARLLHRPRRRDA